MDDDASTTFRPLVGTDEATIDDKNRILVGKKKRDRLGDGFVLTLGAIGCLVAYPAAVWDRLASHVFADSGVNLGRDDYSRLIMGVAEDDLKFDPQGRFSLPKSLKELGRLKDKVLLIGCGDRVELWAPEEWTMFQRFPAEYGRERREAVTDAFARMQAGAPGG